MKIRVWLAIAIFTLVGIFRGTCEKLFTIDINVVMGLINAISLMFVFFFFVSEIYNNLERYKESCIISKKDKGGMFKGVKILLSIVTLVVLMTFGLVYWKIYSAVTNDIVSIIALGFSIITVDVSEAISKCIINHARKKVLSKEGS